MKLFSIRDKASESFGPVYQMQTSGLAERQFANTINNPEMGNMHMHPEDFSLYELGEFNEVSGAIEAYGEPKKVITGFELKRLEKK